MSRRALALYQRCVRAVNLLEDGFLAVTLTAMIALAGSQIALRNFGGGFVWTDELLRVMVLWLGLMGAVAASREPKHVNVDLVTRLLPTRLAALVKVLTHLFTFAVCALVAWYSWEFVLLEKEAGTLFLTGFPAWKLQLVLPVGFGLIAVRFFFHALREIRHALLGEGRVDEAGEAA